MQNLINLANLQNAGVSKTALVAPPIGAQIENVDTYDSGGDFKDNHTLSAFACSGDNRLLVVFVFEKDPDVEVAGVTADGNAMDLQASRGISGVCGVQIYTIENPDASVDIVLSTPSFKRAAFTAMCLSNVDQTTPVDYVVERDGFADSLSLGLVPKYNNSLLLGAFSTQGAQTFAPQTGSTEEDDFAHSADNYQCGVYSKLLALADYSTVGVTHTGSSDNQVGAGIAVRPANDTAPTNLVFDDFSTDTIGGGDWTVAAGTWAVTGGILENTDASGGNWNNRVLLYATGSPTDNFEALGMWMREQTSNGQFMFRSDSGNGYAFQMRGDASGHIRFERWGVANLGGTDTPISDNTWYRFRVRVVGTNFKAKFWQNNEPEPASWQLDVTDATHSTGAIGFGGEDGGGGDHNWDELIVRSTA